jgi:hypothetical protein
VKHAIGILLAIVMVAGNANAQQFYIEGNVKSIYSTNSLMFDRNGSTIDFSDIFGKNKILNEITVNSFLNNRVSVSYSGLYRVSGSGNGAFLGKYTLGGSEIEIKKDDKEPVFFETSVLSNSLQFEWMYQLPFIRPMLKIEQVRVNLGAQGKKISASESFNAFMGGVGLQATQFYPWGSVMAEASYVAGGGSYASQVDLDFRYYIRNLSCYVGAGYRSKRTSIGDVRFNYAGPFAELGMIF